MIERMRVIRVVMFVVASLLSTAFALAVRRLQVDVEERKATRTFLGARSFLVFTYARADPNRLTAIDSAVKVAIRVAGNELVATMIERTFVDVTRVDTTRIVITTLLVTRAPNYQTRTLNEPKVALTQFTVVAVTATWLIFVTVVLASAFTDLTANFAVLVMLITITMSIDVGLGAVIALVSLVFITLAVLRSDVSIVATGVLILSSSAMLLIVVTTFEEVSLFVGIVFACCCFIVFMIMMTIIMLIVLAFDTRTFDVRLLATTLVRHDRWMRRRTATASVLVIRILAALTHCRLDFDVTIGVSVLENRTATITKVLVMRALHEAITIDVTIADLIVVLLLTESTLLALFALLGLLGCNEYHTRRARQAFVLRPRHARCIGVGWSNGSAANADVCVGSIGVRISVGVTITKRCCSEATITASFFLLIESLSITSSSIVVESTLDVVKVEALLAVIVTTTLHATAETTTIWSSIVMMCRLQDARVAHTAASWKTIVVMIDAARRWHVAARAVVRAAIAVEAHVQFNA